MSHNWTTLLHAPTWVTEGIVEWYQLKSCMNTEIYSEGEAHAILADRLDDYLEIYGTENDFSLEYAEHMGATFPYELWYFIVYKKGSLVAFTLDQSIRELTSGESSLDNVMQYLFSTKDGHHPNSQSILNAVNTATEYDFTFFFDDYVFDVERLPLEVNENELVEVDFNVLPPIGPLDADGDGLIYSRELELGTDPTDPDSDDDDLNDFEELGVMEIDGQAEDWTQWVPVVTDEQGDTTHLIPGTDLKDVYVVFSDDNLYLMVTLYDGKPNFRDAYDLAFDTNGDGRIEFIGSLWPTGVASMWDWRQEECFCESNRMDTSELEILGDDVMEMRFPLSFLDNPETLYLKLWLCVFEGNDCSNDDGIEPEWTLLPESNRLYSTDPLNPDTDGDGYSDGIEIEAGTNPLDPNSYPRMIYLPLIMKSR